MIYKLQQNGISGELLNILVDFLNNRKQRVVLNGQTSNWIDVKAGVPQGSIMGPLLFLIYINDLPEGLITNAKLFADDTSLFSVVRDIAASTEELNNDLRNISKWAYQWKMIFKPDLTKQAQEVIISRKLNKPIHPNVTFNPLMHDVPKWSDTLQKSCSKCSLFTKPSLDHILIIGTWFMIKLTMRHFTENLNLFNIPLV